MRSQAKSTPWPTLFFALLGLIWCGYVAFPTATPLPCSTSGCALFRDSKFAGVSLWWAGGAYFFLLTVLCLRGNRHLARPLAGLALFLDAILLIIMFLTAPCFDCLVVAALMGLCYYTLRSSANGDGWFTGNEATHSLLLPVWFGLFLGNSVLAANEQLPLYSLGNKRSTEISVYFSPSCPACREAILSLGNAAVLYPVAESAGDTESIIRFAALLESNVPIQLALERCLNPDEPLPYLPFYETGLLRMQLLRNKAALLRQGFRALPLIQVNGMPGHPNTPLNNGAAKQLSSSDVPVQARPSESLPGQTSPAPGEDLESWSRQGSGSPEGLPDFLQDPGDLRQCGGENAEPCE